MKKFVQVIMILVIISISKYSYADDPEPDSTYYYKPYFVENGCIPFDVYNNETIHITQTTGYTEVAQPYVIPEGESITVKGIAFKGYFFFNLTNNIYEIVEPGFLNINIYQDDRIIKSVPFDTCIRYMENTSISQIFHEAYFDEEIELSGNFLISIETFPIDFYGTYVEAYLSAKSSYCQSVYEADIYNPIKKCNGSWEQLDFSWNEPNGNIKFLQLYPILASNENNENPSDDSGLSDIVKNNTFLSPNPAKDFVEITSSFKIKTIDIVNMQGKRMFSKQLDNYMTQIDINSLPSGSYIVKIHTDKGDTTRTIIKE
ncbi:MAG: T9SS type A sorting domain-containing protein [Bacteroidales bacterium]|nr:T9SS type A sorting domain-containing protein [Bacteroidales bacterium]